MSGVFSIASHCGLQYFPDLVVVQVHGGCAHFLLSSAAIGVLLEISFNGYGVALRRMK